MDALMLRLRPFVPADGPTGRGAALRVVAVGDGFEVGVAVPGHGDQRGGLVSPEDLVAFAKQLIDAAGAVACANWRAHQVLVRPARAAAGAV